VQKHDQQMTKNNKEIKQLQAGYLSGMGVQMPHLDLLAI
jgi:hypothetical protein